MEKKDQRNSSKRQYPPVYEKIVPIALGIIVVAIIVLLLIAISVILGIFPGSG
ncbi:MAG: hypothetical protein GXP39_12785 [Chloroflexi bacterium]|nr:hypothetical protein [Chloroflexota bacterium]